VDLIKLYGSMELAPLTGLADAIVDLVSTGSTLKANPSRPTGKTHHPRGQRPTPPGAWGQAAPSLTAPGGHS
jgi:hypothetical protein